MSIRLTDDLKKEYIELFEKCEVNPEKAVDVEKLCQKFLKNKSTYEKVEIVPWYIVAVIHQMESSCNFKRHLHNGDPLTARTINVPAGRPKKGEPPFDWYYSAKDALSDKSIPKNWTIEDTLYFLEAYNGFGYRKYHPEVKSPYLWGLSNCHTTGKYTSDGKFSSRAKTSQVGAAVLLKHMWKQYWFTFDSYPIFSKEDDVEEEKIEEKKLGTIIINNNMKQTLFDLINNWIKSKKR